MEPLGSNRPLTARSVIASTLLGMHPPRLSSQLLVRSGELFGISEGTTRTAISRMVNAGELEPDGDGYRLTGPLLARQARQDASRVRQPGRWRGSWEMAVVRVERRSASTRAELREAMRRLRLAELREGVWMRPANLDAERSPESWEVVDAQCLRFEARPPGEGDPTALAAGMWDLDGWAKGARALLADIDATLPALEDRDPHALARGFVLSASVLRHLLADPFLPDELLPADWPGNELRTRYDVFDRAFGRTWFTWFRDQE